MKIEAKIYYLDAEREFYCFEHAVKAVIEERKKITPIIDDSYNMPTCIVCGVLEKLRRMQSV